MGKKSIASKVAIITAIATVIAAIVTGLFSLYNSQSSIKTEGDCSAIVTGNINGGLKAKCK